MLWQKTLTRKGEYGVSNRGEMSNFSYWGQVRIAEKMAFEQRLQRGGFGGCLEEGNSRQRAK